MVRQCPIRHYLQLLAEQEFFGSEFFYGVAEFDTPGVRGGTTTEILRLRLRMTKQKRIPSGNDNKGPKLK